MYVYLKLDVAQVMRGFAINVMMTSSGRNFKNIFSLKILFKKDLWFDVLHDYVAKELRFLEKMTSLWRHNFGNFLS